MCYGAKKVASSSLAVHKNEDQVTFTVQAAKPDELSTVSPGRGVALVILILPPSVSRIRRHFTPIQVSNALHPGEKLIIFFFV